MPALRPMTPYGTFIETRCVSVTTPSSDALTDDDEIVGVWGVGPFSTLRGRRDDCVESFSFVFRDSLLSRARPSLFLMPAASRSASSSKANFFWTGEKDLAIEQIAATLQVPGRLSYGQL